MLKRDYVTKKEVTLLNGQREKTKIKRKSNMCIIDRINFWNFTVNILPKYNHNQNIKEKIICFSTILVFEFYFEGYKEKIQTFFIAF